MVCKYCILYEDNKTHETHVEKLNGSSIEDAISKLKSTHAYRITILFVINVNMLGL